MSRSAGLVVADVPLDHGRAHTFGDFDDEGTELAASTRQRLRWKRQRYALRVGSFVEREMCHAMFDSTASLSGPERNRSIAILVLGMGRSGTSALTRVINLAGASIAERLLPHNPFNETGYWEPVDVVTFHDEILARHESYWDDVRPLPQALFDAADSNGARTRIEEFVAEYAAKPLWALKDPRLARLAPLWLEVLARREIDVRCVLPYRNPIEVARSVEGFGLERAEALAVWLTFELDAELHSRGRRRVFTSYESLLADPERVLERVGESLAIAWPTTRSERASEIREFVASGRRHHRAPDDELFRDPSIPDLVRQMYEALREAERGKSEMTPTFDRIRASWVEAQSVLGPAVAERRRRAARVESEDAERRAAVGRDLDELRAQNALLRAELVEREESLAAANSRSAEDARRSRTEIRTARDATRVASATTQALWPMTGVAWLLGRNPSRDREAAMAMLSRAATFVSGRPRLAALVIARSGLFDATFYCTQLRVTKPARWSIAHYLRVGAEAGTNPSPFFDDSFYREVAPDLRERGVNPLIHYALVGALAGLDPSTRFSTKFYLTNNPDVATSGMNPLFHYMHFGRAEGRSPAPEVAAEMWDRRAAESD